MEKSALIEGRKHAPRHLGRVLVLGLGKSGRAAVAYLLPLLGGRVEALAIAAGARTEASEAPTSTSIHEAVHATSWMMN